MGQPTQHLAADLFGINRLQLRTVTSLPRGDGCLTKYMHRIGITKAEPICRACNEEEKTPYRIVFEYAALEQGKLSLVEPTNLLTDLPKRYFIKPNKRD